MKCADVTGRSVRERVVSDYDYVVCPGFRTTEGGRKRSHGQILIDRFCNGDHETMMAEDQEGLLISGLQ